MTKIKVQDIKRVIKDIQKLDTDLRVLGSRATPDIIGFYGELLVWKELKSKFSGRGYDIGFGSGQSKADITLRKNGQRINIEVKTSRFKHDWYGDGYGYALNIKSCQTHPGKKFDHPKKGTIHGDFCYFDYLVAVLMADELASEDYKFYIFSRDFILKHKEELRNKNKRFSSVSHRMIFIDNKTDTDEITSFDINYLTKNKRKKFEDGWDIILNH